VARKQNYLVTDASIYTVHPVVTEHRYQMIEEINPPPYELGPFSKFAAGCLGAALGLKLVLWILGLFCHC
jgi:hypothetical protein